MDLGKITGHLKKRWLWPTAVILLIGFFVGPYLIGRACYAGDTVYVLNQSGDEVANGLDENAHQANWQSQNNQGHPLHLVSLKPKSRDDQRADDKSGGYDPSRKQEDWWGSFWCEVKLTDWIVAYFTFILAGATILLFRATEKLYITGENQIEAANAAAVIQRDDVIRSMKAAEDSAEAAKLTAEAGVKAELPRLHISKITINASAYTTNHQWPDNLLFSIIIKNYGRTPALITKISTTICIGPTLPANPAHTIGAANKVLYPTNIIQPNGEETFTDGKYYQTGAITKAPFILTHQNTILYVFGYLRFMDFLNEEHEVGFIFGWIPAQKFFIPIFNMPEYHYQR